MEKKVPMAVAHMDCVPVPVLVLIFILIVTTTIIMIMVLFKVRYVDYENKTTEAMADNIDCFVHKKPVNHR